VLALLSVVGGCKAHGTFSCDTAAQCGQGARCEANHACSFEDSRCSSGWRYDEYAAGGVAGVCVGEESIDAGVGTDVRPDAMQAPGCPAGYVVVPGQSGGYRYVATADDWLAAEQDCENDGSGTHLAVVGGGNEIDAIKDLPPGGDTTLWIGASDRVTEGTYLTVLDTPQTYLPWDLSQPTGAGQNCIAADEDNFRDDDCMQSREYVCECDGMPPVPSSY
jgi:hypothetical protein